VRELLASLLVSETVRRAEIAEQMWPDHDPSKARDNLRVTLSHLTKALTVPGQPPYLDVNDQTVSLPHAHLDIDRDRFEEAYRGAVLADRQSNPSSALEGYLVAVGLATGSYLPDSDVDEVRFERLRLDTLAITAMCRAAELLLAKGEPEWSLELASKALGRDPLSERAARTAVSANVALDSVTGAQQVAKALLADLHDARLSPGPDTVAAFAKIGIMPTA
jgi:DNA-binding SARP family transcriptional activator